MKKSLIVKHLECQKEKVHASYQNKSKCWELKITPHITTTLLQNAIT